MWVDQRSSLTAAAEERSESDALIFWALLLTVKQDTVKTSNQISDTRWGALSGLRLEQPVICEPTLEEWGTGRRSPRIEDWLQIPLRGK